MPRPRIPEVVRLPITYHIGKDHVVAVIHIGKSTIGLRFESPEQLLMFMAELIEKAAVVWPDNRWIKEYKSNEQEAE